MATSMPFPGLIDTRGRIARYLRISITDRCNLACFYCKGDAPQKFIPHAQILRYEEITRLIVIARKMGIKKIRITGGEPFARKDCMELLGSIHRQFPDIALCLTTNGTLLEPFIKELANIAPQAINVSIDSFRPETYAELTGRHLLENAINNVDRLLVAGLRVKINAVAIRDITDMQIDDFIHAIRHMPVDLRFIEFMPVGSGSLWNTARFLPCAELRQKISDRIMLTAAQNIPVETAGPALMYDLPGHMGRFGFIQAMSSHFCNSCNRLRLTSDGRLKLCLFSDREYALAGLLRNKKISDAVIVRVMGQICRLKPLGSQILAQRGNRPAGRRMAGIGG